MTAFFADWLNLIIRWSHIVAGIGWIGTSFYFIALDLSLKRDKHTPAGVAGTAWEVHGGGFYRVDKYALAPPQLPGSLIWYRWEAYLTWVTGFALLVVQYYLNASAWLIDPEIMRWLPWQAIAISAISLAVGWFAYDGLCRSVIGNRPKTLGVAVFVLVLMASYFYTHVFSGRSALIHVGAFIGTVMAVNVFGIIIPNQKKAVAAMLEGRQPDASYAELGKQRSLHNTYLTLPVLVLMVSGHYPMLTGHPHAWLLVGLIVVGGASARYLLVHIEIGEAFSKFAWTLPVLLAVLVTAVWLTYPAEPGHATAVTDEQIVKLLQTHCVGCHAAQPTHPGFAEAPKNVVLERLDDLRRYAVVVNQHTVQTKSMPLGNLTGMGEDDRQRLGAWLARQ